MSSWTSPILFYRASTAEAGPRATQLAQQLGLSAIENCPTNQRNEAWQLLVGEQDLQLLHPDGTALASNFGLRNATRRAAESGFSRQAMMRALAIRKLQTGNRRVRVLDATGGLGQDAFTLALLGCELWVLERNPLVHCLLQDAWQQASRSASTTAMASRVSLLQADAQSNLADIALSSQIDLIYLDPMYPARRQRGKSRKGMQFLHAFIGPDRDNDLLLGSALNACAHANGYRVVVKRPAAAAALALPDEWQGQLTEVSSSNTRYDIYHHKPIKL